MITFNENLSNRNRNQNSEPNYWHWRNPSFSDHFCWVVDIFSTYGQSRFGWPLILSRSPKLVFSSPGVPRLRLYHYVTFFPYLIYIMDNYILFQNIKQTSKNSFSFPHVKNLRTPHNHFINDIHKANGICVHLNLNNQILAESYFPEILRTAQYGGLGLNIQWSKWK